MTRASSGRGRGSGRGKGRDVDKERDGDSGMLSVIVSAFHRMGACANLRQVCGHLDFEVAICGGCGTVVGG